MNPFLAGLVAGYTIAIPVGAIAILIIDTGLRGGFKPGFAAGAGAASADLTYAALAALAGAVLAPLVRPYEIPLRAMSGVVLIALGGWGLWRLRSLRKSIPAGPSVPISGACQTYVKFLGLTLINPLTIIYFAALILGGGTQALASPAGRALFVLGAGVSSLSWQSLLAAIGALAHHHLPPRFQFLTSLLGNLVVVALGARFIILSLIGAA